jgi:hypothetical protein
MSSAWWFSREICMGPGISSCRRGAGRGTPGSCGCLRKSLLSRFTQLWRRDCTESSPQTFRSQRPPKR